MDHIPWLAVLQVKARLYTCTTSPYHYHYSSSSSSISDFVLV